MNERAADHAGREKKIRQLEQNLSRMRREAVEHGKIEEKLQYEIRDWKRLYDEEKSEKEFYHKNASEHKKNNRVIKIALARIQEEYDKLKEKCQVQGADLDF